MRKKILFVLPSLKNGGGTIRSLQNLLLHLPIDRYNVEVLPINFEPFDTVKLINCNVLPNQKTLMAIGTNVRHLIYLKNLWIIINVFLRKVLLFFFRRVGGYHKFLPLYLASTANKINNLNYDSIIAFQEGFPTFFCSMLKANNKIAWIHSNYKEYVKLIKKDEQYIYSNFNQIICVSAFTKQEFLNFFPQYHEKASYIYNVLDENFIKTQSVFKIDDSRFDNSHFTIISIGRIDPVKQFSKLPGIAYKLKQKNLKFKWYLLGDGNPNELRLILKNTVHFNVEDCFVYLGGKFNPYPYIANSNLLVSSSFSEACPYVVNEAKVLGVPIVSTDYGSSYEFVNHNVNGYITPLDKMSIIIEQLINNEDTYTQIRNNVKKFVYDNEMIVKKLVEIL